jgi:[acyl-carrier-protein] S-malonyltransferase
VRWVECVQELRATGARLHLEVGPGNVLCGLAARIDRALARAGVSALGDVAGAEQALAEACA